LTNVKKLECRPSRTRFLAISMPKQEAVTTKHPQLERHPTCYLRLSLIYVLIQSLIQFVMCRPIKQHPTNTESQTGKDETNRQDTKKRSPVTNTQYIKKSKYTHSKFSNKVKTFCSFQYKSTTTAGKDYRHAVNKSSPNCLHRIHGL
jgi:hypothetical protein